MESRSAVWMTAKEIVIVGSLVANCLDSSNTSAEDKLILVDVDRELGVAKSRYETGPIPPKELRTALGKEQDTVPVKLSRVEALVLLRCIDLPISVRNKVFSST